MSKQAKGIILAASGAALWGISGAAAQYLFATTNISNTWLVGLRLLGAGVLLTLWCLLKQPHQLRAMVTNRGNLKLLILFAILGMTNSQLSYFLAIKYSNAPTATGLYHHLAGNFDPPLAAADRLLQHRLGTGWDLLFGHRGPTQPTDPDAGCALLGDLVCRGGRTIHPITPAPAQPL